MGSAFAERRRGNYGAAIAIHQKIVGLANRPWRPLKDDLKLLFAYIDLFGCYLRLERYEESIEHGRRGLALLLTSVDFGWRNFTRAHPTTLFGKPIEDTSPELMAAFLRDLRRTIERHGGDADRRDVPAIERILSELPHTQG